MYEVLRMDLSGGDGDLTFKFITFAANYYEEVGAQTSHIAQPQTPENEAISNASDEAQHSKEEEGRVNINIKILHLKT